MLSEDDHGRFCSTVGGPRMACFSKVPKAARFENVSRAHATPSPIRLFRWAEQAAEALVFCHKTGILLGDIDCSNYFLTRTLELKVGDFATSAIDEPTRALYSITHQLPDVDTTSHLTEIFAFGSSLYEMVTGRVPYPDLDSDEVEARCRRKQFPALSTVEVLIGTIWKCWMVESESTEDVFKAIKAEGEDLERSIAS